MASKRKLAVGMIGYNFMGKAHSNAWRQAARFFDLPAEIGLHTICGRDPREEVGRAAAQLGWEKAEHRLARGRGRSRDRHHRHLHAERYATRRSPSPPREPGKAILCEKPLGLNVAECEAMVAAVKKARVVNMVCHNYRRIPAIALAKRMIESGALGDRIYHYRARYAQDWITDPNFPLVWRLQSEIAGSGAHGDIDAHIIDLGRYLVGEIKEVCGLMETFIKERPLLEETGGGLSAEAARRSARSPWMTPCRGSADSKTARSPISKPPVSRWAAKTTSPSRSTAAKARSPSTSRT